MEFFTDNCMKMRKKLNILFYLSVTEDWYWGGYRGLVLRGYRGLILRGLQRTGTEGVTEDWYWGGYIMMQVYQEEIELIDCWEKGFIGHVWEHTLHDGVEIVTGASEGKVQYTIKHHKWKCIPTRTGLFWLFDPRAMQRRDCQYISNNY